MLQERVQPQAVEVERAVLGAMLIDKGAIGQVLEILDETCFYRTAHRYIYQAIVSLFERDEPADTITVVEELRRRKQLDEVDGPVYVASLASDVATAGNTEGYAKIVQEKALLRKLITAASEMAGECYEETDDVRVLIDRAEQRVFEISERRLRRGFEPMDSIMRRAVEGIELAQQSPGMGAGVPTGYRQLDERLTGLRKSDLIVLAGRTSMGKTALALCVARHAAMYREVPVGIFSLEMSSTQLAERFLAAEARLDSHHVRLGRLSDEEWTRLGVKVGQVASAPIFIDDSSSLSILEMRAKARRLRMEKKIQLLIVDYLQLVSVTGKVESRTQEVSQVSRSLKALAKELDIPVLALSQLSRQTDARSGRRPRLSDLRESGSIEQDADVVLFIHRPSVYGDDEFEDGTPAEGMAEVIIGKQRSGPIGSVYLTWIEENARFEDPELYRDVSSF